MSSLEKSQMETLPIKSRQEFDQIVDQASDYVADWIQQHITEISLKSNIIFGSTQEDVYKIGHMVLARVDQTHWVAAKDYDDFKTFNDRSSALFYCLYLIDNQIVEANQIFELDQTIEFLQENCRQYLVGLKRTRNNLEKYNILLARYRNDSQRINTCKQHLKKILSIAKYKKTRKFHELNRH